MYTLDTKAFPCPSAQRTYWAAGYWSTDGLFYRTRPMRETHAQAMQDARVLADREAGAQLRMSCDDQAEMQV